MIKPHNKSRPPSHPPMRGEGTEVPPKGMQGAAPLAILFPASFSYARERGAPGGVTAQTEI